MCELDLDFRSLRVGKVAYPLEQRDLRVCLDTVSSCEMRTSDTTVGAYMVILPERASQSPISPIIIPHCTLSGRYTYVDVH